MASGGLESCGASWLPWEMVHQVLSVLFRQESPSDFFACRAVCRRWKCVADDILASKATGGFDHWKDWLADWHGYTTDCPWYCDLDNILYGHFHGCDCGCEPGQLDYKLIHESGITVEVPTEADVRTLPWQQMTLHGGLLKDADGWSEMSPIRSPITCSLATEDHFFTGRVVTINCVFN